MREELKIMQRIKNLTSAYPLSATRLTCTQCAHIAQCGKARWGVVWNAVEKARQEREREGVLPVAWHLIYILIFDI